MADELEPFGVIVDYLTYSTGKMNQLTETECFCENTLRPRFSVSF